MCVARNLQNTSLPQIGASKYSHKTNVIYDKKKQESKEVRVSSLRCQGSKYSRKLFSRLPLGANGVSRQIVNLVACMVNRGDYVKEALVSECIPENAWILSKYETNKNIAILG